MSSEQARWHPKVRVSLWKVRHVAKRTPCTPSGGADSSLKFTRCPDLGLSRDFLQTPPTVTVPLLPHSRN